MLRDAARREIFAEEAAARGEVVTSIVYPVNGQPYATTIPKRKLAPE
jgi:hypothetical protein